MKEDAKYIHSNLYQSLDVERLKDTMTNEPTSQVLNDWIANIEKTSSLLLEDIVEKYFDEDGQPLCHKIFEVIFVPKSGSTFMEGVRATHALLRTLDEGDFQVVDDKIRCSIPEYFLEG